MSDVSTVVLSIIRDDRFFSIMPLHVGNASLTIHCGWLKMLLFFQLLLLFSFESIFTSETIPRYKGEILHDDCNQ